MFNSEINFFAKTDYRNLDKKFGIKTDDRRRHVYIIGKTGMGKTNLLQNMAIQDIQDGKGIAFVDPHGEVAENLLNFIPSSRVNDVVYVNPADIDWPIAFNVMEKVDVEYRHLIASGLMGVFKKIWPDVWSARMEYILNNAILALLEYPGSTLLGVNRMLSDNEFRDKVVEQLTDPVVKAFWVTEYSRYSQKYETEATAAIQNKVGQFISNPLVRNIIGQVKSSIDMRDVMDSGKILIINLSKGRIGEDNSTLLGALMITKLQLAAMSRIDILEEERKDFYLYVDEFQNFATESFANILSEARKFRLSLILAHQYINQMEEEVRDAVFGNVGTMISFRIGAEDAEYMEKEFSPEFMAQDFVNLGKYDIYIKLMIDGIAGRPFSAKTLPPFILEEESNKDKIINVSRERYSTPREKVEEAIAKWSGVMMATAQENKRNAKLQGTLYDAVCSLCKKDTKVVFPPDGKRPVYCKSCLKKIRSEAPKKESQEAPSAKPRIEQEKIVEPKISLKDAIESETVNFGRRRSESIAPEKKEKKKRKEVDVEDLKKTLQASLKKFKDK